MLILININTEKYPALRSLLDYGILMGHWTVSLIATSDHQ